MDYEIVIISNRPHLSQKVQLCLIILLYKLRALKLFLPGQLNLTFSANR